ncbi:MAG: LemA family protein [Candidatus Aenigmatarchaeota archaeon]
MAAQDFISKYKWPLIAGVIILIIIGSIIGIYNNFVVLKQNINGEWSLVENQYQRQADLIPNLVATVSSAVTVETRFVTDVTAARSQWQTTTQSSDLLSKDSAGVNLQNSINAFIKAVATTENYPVLQANKNYIALQDELVGTQNRLAYARANYIDAIRQYNTAIQVFPGIMFAGTFGFAPQTYYQAAPGALVTPIVGTATALP